MNRHKTKCAMMRTLRNVSIAEIDAEIERRRTPWQQFADEFSHRETPSENLDVLRIRCKQLRRELSAEVAQ